MVKSICFRSTGRTGLIGPHPPDRPSGLRLTPDLCGPNPEYKYTTQHLVLDPLVFTPHAETREIHREYRGRYFT